MTWFSASSNSQEIQKLIHKIISVKTLTVWLKETERIQNEKSFLGPPNSIVRKQANKATQLQMSDTFH